MSVAAADEFAPGHHVSTACRLCGGARLVPVLSLAPSPPANAFVGADALGHMQTKYPLNLHFCEDCHHLQLVDVIAPSVLFDHYVYVTGTSPTTLQHFRGYVSDVVEIAGLRPGDLVVDIGSNDGTVLSLFREAGMRVLGVDPAREIAEQANARGIKTVTAYFTPALATRIRDEFGAAKVICANNVFAHIADMQGVINGIRKLLDDDGTFVFEVSYLLDVFEKTLFDTIYHEHLDYHRVGPLRRFFQDNGMTLFDVDRVAPHGGSLRGYAALRESGRVAEAAVDELAALEHRQGLDRPETFRRYAARIGQAGLELTSLLEGLKRAGKSVAGYGAPAKATTLMHHFHLDRDMIAFIADDAPAKQGLFTPGLHVPVVAPEVLYERRPDYLVILAWNFAEPIMTKHAAYREGGGRFIVPLPALNVH